MEDYTSKESMLRYYLRIFFRHKYVIIATIIIIMLTTFIRMQLVTPQYNATVKLLMKGLYESDIDYYENIRHPRGIIVSYTEIVKSKAVLERVVRALKLYQRPLDEEKRFAPKLKAIFIDRSIKQLRDALEEMNPEQRAAFLFSMAMDRLQGSISTSVEEDTFIFSLYVRDFNPNVAPVIANSVARSLVIYDLEQQIAELKLKYGEKHSIVKKLQNYVANLYEKLDGRVLPDMEAMGPASIKIIEQAQSAVLITKRSKSLTFVVVFFLSLLMGLLLSIIFDYIDQTIQSPHDIENFLGVPFLGSIPSRKPKDKLLISEANPKTTDYTRSYYHLSDQIYLLMKIKNMKSILVVGMEAADEIAIVISNLGIYLSNKVGHKVLIIDANLRSPSIAKIFNISNRPGICDVLEQRIAFEDAIQDVVSNLSVLPAGETVFNPITLLDSPTMSNLIKEAKDRYDIVFINCADMKNFTDAVTLSSFSDGIVFVINEGRERRHVVKNAITHFEQKKVEVIGAILNNRKYVIPELIYKLT